MLDAVIVGAGGFAREVYRWAIDAWRGEIRVKGFLSPDPRALDGFPGLPPVLGSDVDYTIEPQDRFLLGLGECGVKRRAVETLLARGASFLTLVHPTALVASSATLGEGVVVCPHALVSDSVRLGDFVLLNFYASCGHDAEVGAFGSLSPYATLNGYAVLEEEVFAGSHASVAARRRVGSRSKIAANSSVLQDVPQRALVIGSPGIARVVY